MSVFVGEYFTRKTLAGLGYRFDPENLSFQKARYFRIIESEISELQSKEAKEVKEDVSKKTPRRR